MDPSVSQQTLQNNNGDYSIDDLLDSAQTYASQHDVSEESNFNFPWENNSMFPHLAEQDRTQPQPAREHHSQDWSQAQTQHSLAQNPQRPADDPRLRAFGNFPIPYPAHQYASPTLQPRPSPQPVFDQRQLGRPNPSPAAFQQHSQYFQPNAFRDQHIAPAPSLQQPMRQQSGSPASFHQQPAQSPYFHYGQQVNRNSPLSGVDMNPFQMYPDNQNRPLMINPSLLQHTNGISDMSTEAQKQKMPTFAYSGMGMLTPTMMRPVHPQQSQVRPGLAPMPVSTAGQQGMLVPAQGPRPVGRPKKIKVPKDPNAPRRPRGRPRKDGSIRSPRADGEASSSDYTSDDELEIEEAPEPLPDLLRSIPQADSNDKLIFDAVSAVWSPRNLAANPDKVRHGIGLFADTVKKLRDIWKARNEKFKTADNENLPSASVLKQEVSTYRNLMEQLVRECLKFGHPNHLQNLGENHFTVSVFQSFLVDRITAGDLDGPLVTVILRLLMKFRSLDTGMIEKLKVDKTLSRLLKKAKSAETRSLAQAITENAKKAAQSKAQQKNGGSDSPIRMNGAAVTDTKAVLGKKVDAVAGIKRAREGDAPAPIKRVVASKPLALQSKEKDRKATLGIGAKITSGSSVTATKPKIVVAPKPAIGAFSSLMSASKKPGTSNADRAALAKEKVKPTTAKAEIITPAPKEVPVAKPTSSFMDMLADMNAEKKQVVKKEEPKPDETPEQKARRERKEQRRHLRVSWYPDDQLTQTRLFTHDPDEEIGDDDNSARRDAGDIRSEGRMLKSHRDLEEFDEDDEVSATGENLEAYTLPTHVDFGVVEESSPGQLADAYIKAAGNLLPTSPESEAQNKREAENLIVVHAVPSDVPDNPREPAGIEDDDYDPDGPRPFGEPEDKVRRREEHHYAKVSQQPEQPQQQYTYPQSTANGTPDLSVLIRNMQPPQQQYSQPAAPTPNFDIARLMAIVQNVNQGQQQQPSQAYVPPQPLQNAQTPAINENLAALLAQFQNQGAPSSSLQQANALPLGLGANPTSFLGGAAAGNKHSRNGSEDENGAKKKKKPDNDGINMANYKTVVCRFYQEGKCLKGDDCTYRHDE